MMKAFKEIGGGRFMETDRFTAYSSSDGKPGIGISIPFDGKPATVGNGTMVALQVDTPEKVNSFYAKAISLGAKDEVVRVHAGTAAFMPGIFVIWMGIN